MKKICAVFALLLCAALLARHSLPRLAGQGSATLEFTAAEDTWDSTQQVQLLDGSTENLETYLTAVLLGEIPASFPEEALKAQAVAARTYTRKAMQSGKHGGKLCKNASCCQAYCDPAYYLAQGGSPENLERMTQAVRQTDALVMLYDGAYIEATYFSCSGGRTEDAVDVWGMDYPYLRTTQSPGEEEAEVYRSSRFYTRQALEETLHIALPDSPLNWVEKTEWTSGGGVKSMTLAGVTFTGIQLRQRLGLPSAAFTVYPDGDGLRFEIRGYGHRVGLSQYGAEAMAREGASFREILEHYYTGVEIRSEKHGENVEK